MGEKEMFITIVTKNLEMSVYPDELEKCAGLNFSINFKKNSSTFLNIRCKYFRHRLRYEHRIDNCNYYSLDLR